LEVSNILNHRAERPLSGQEMAKFLVQKLKYLFEENDVDFAYLGGSWAKDIRNWWSDIDIFISVPRFPQLSSKTQLEFLTHLHVKATDLTTFEEIEVLVLEILPLHIQFNAIADGVLIYEKDPEINTSFIEKLLPLYYDHMIWYKKLLNQSEYIEPLGENHD